MDRDGRFIGLRLDWICNSGAYLSQAGPLINTLNPSTHAINVYRIPALYGRHRLALTNTTPITAYRGAGRPNVSYLVERLVDEAARETGIDRVEIRRRNLIPKEAFPYKTPAGSTYDSGNPPGYMEDALKHSDGAGFTERKRECERRGQAHGSALVATARAAVKKGLELAAKELEVALADVEFRDGRYTVKGTDLAISFQQIARRYSSQLDSLEGIAGPLSFPGGAHVAEVE